MSRYFPRALFIYLPRVANCIADDLAGQASRFMLNKYRRDPKGFCRNTGPVSIKPHLPTPLLQAGGFQIQSCEHPWAPRALTLVEKPCIDHGLLRRHLNLSPQHRQLIESYLSPRTVQRPNIEVAYSPRAIDGQGRKYCNTIGGQRLPREVRLLLFGRTHCEIDLKGSFYELTRRLGLRFLPSHIPLPPIDDLRAMLSQDPYISMVEADRPHTIKQLPLRIINSSIETTYQYLRTIREGSPNANTDAILHQLWSLSQALTEQLLPRYRPHYTTRQSDSTFRLLEYFEALVVEETIGAIIACHPTHSLVWLHDGFLIAPPPPETTLRQIEATVLARHHLHVCQKWFKVTPLEESYENYKDALKGAASAPILALSRPRSSRTIGQVTTAQARVQIHMSPLEALGKLRARRDRLTSRK